MEKLSTNNVTLLRRNTTNGDGEVAGGTQLNFHSRLSTSRVDIEDSRSHANQLLSCAVSPCVFGRKMQHSNFSAK